MNLLQIAEIQDSVSDYRVAMPQIIPQCYKNQHLKYEIDWTISTCLNQLKELIVSHRRTHSRTYTLIIENLCF